MTDAVITNAVATDAVETGVHACLTFTYTEERLDVVATFVRDGLQAGSKVRCLTDTLTPTPAAGR